jgi:predicted amidohydrolase YtcJ
MHSARGTTWQWEVRPTAWSPARRRWRCCAPERPPSVREWGYTLGGWAIEQFSDDKRLFTRDELIRRFQQPLFLQASYREAYLNSKAPQAMAISETATPDA